MCLQKYSYLMDLSEFSGEEFLGEDFLAIISNDNESK